MIKKMSWFLCFVGCFNVQAAGQDVQAGGQRIEVLYCLDRERGLLSGGCLESMPDDSQIPVHKNGYLISEISQGNHVVHVNELGQIIGDNTLGIVFQGGCFYKQKRLER